MDPDDLVCLERIPRSQTVLGFAPFKFLPIQTNLFDNVSVSDSDSELSGPFSDIVYSKEFEGKNKAKQLYGKNLYAAFSFSAKFKCAMENIKKEKSDDPDYTETNNTFSEDFNLPSEIVEKIDFHFDFPDVDRGDDSEIEEKKKEKNGVIEKKKSAKIFSDEDELFDTMSGYWRLLSAFDEFRISPPWFDAYAEGKEHWLQTKPIPEDIFESSRLKCLNWLQNYFNK